jgi:hypothetical protein
MFEREPGRPHAAALTPRLIRDVAIAHGGRMDVASPAGAFATGSAFSLIRPVR